MIWFRRTLLGFALVGLPACSGGGEEDVTGDSGSSRVAVAKFYHETCTFCPGGDTEELVNRLTGGSFRCLS
jgi:hypothetical protein